MRITVLAAGSRGDVEPFLAFAYGLTQAGHQVRLAANANFRPLAESYGLDFFALDNDSYAFLQNGRAQSWLESNNIFELALRGSSLLRPALRGIVSDAWRACQETEAIIYHSFTCPMAYYIGKRLGIPALPVSLYPMPTRAHPALSIHTPYHFGAPLNRLSHLLVDQFTWLIYWRVARALWKGQQSVSLATPLRHLLKERRPIICSYSSFVLPRPADSHDHVYIVGYWHLDPPPDWQPDPELLSFLHSGPPPVFVGFASMGNPARAGETTELVLEALARCGQRGVLVSGWNGLGTGVSLPDSVIVLKSIPYAWLFPKMSLIVHHGGAGTTGLALRAGVPNVTIPHFADNHFWARRVTALGVAPPPIPRKTLTVESLAQAISQALENQNMHRRAAMVGKQLQAENGIVRAIELLQQSLSGSR